MAFVISLFSTLDVECLRPTAEMAWADADDVDLLQKILLDY